MLQELISTYVPNLEKCLDNLGRILITLWMQETEVKESIGDEAFVGLEEKIRNIFKGLGEVILDINSKTVGGQEMGGQESMMLGDQQ
jgi:hypothetical protein